MTAAGGGTAGGRGVLAMVSGCRPHEQATGMAGQVAGALLLPILLYGTPCLVVLFCLGVEVGLDRGLRLVSFLLGGSGGTGEG